MTMPDLRRSIKRFDILPNGMQIMNIFGANGLQPHLLPELSKLVNAGGTSMLDQALHATLMAEGMWSSAVNIAVSAVVTADWECSGDVPLRNKQAREILQYTSYTSVIEKALTDYLTCQNGTFVETIRVSNARGSRVLGLDHLDTMYCERTGDPEVPVLYTDAAGKVHELRWWQVFDLVDMPSPRRGAMGRGICAAYRAYSYIRKLATIETYVIEKVGGKRPLAIYLVNNLSPTTLESGIATAVNPFDDEPHERQLSQAYMGALVIPLPTQEPVTMVKIPLAELPDGFNRNEEWSISLLAYAKALGLDPQDLQPLTGQALGTGAQSGVLHNKAAAYGIGAFKQKWIEALRERVIPAGVTFYFNESDMARRKVEAELAKIHTDDLAVQVEKLGLTADQARQIKHDLGEMPAQFLAAPDSTPDLSVGNNDAEEALNAAQTPDPAAVVA